MSKVLPQDLVGLTSLVGNRFGFLNLKVGFLEEIGHSEPLVKDGVEHKFVVIAPGLAQTVQFALLGFLV